MQTHTDTRRLEQIKSAIDALDLEPIKFKIGCKQDGYGWISEHVDQIELAYRRFLVLHAQYPQLQIAPTRDIDAFWHAHILDTRKYAANCQHIFGEFVHHYPYLGMLGDPDQRLQAADTLNQLFVSEFGAEAPNNARHARAGGSTAAWCGVEVPANKSAAWCGGVGLWQASSFAADRRRRQTNSLTTKERTPESISTPCSEQAFAEKRPLRRHSREGGNPRSAAMLDSRLRGNDGTSRV